MLLVCCYNSLMENNKKQTINTPTAILVAGFLIMLGILISNGIGSKSPAIAKTLSEQVGVKKADFDACMKSTDLQGLLTKTNLDVENAMKGIPAEQRGTPYSIIIGKNGSKTEIRGAYPKEAVQKLIDEVTAGKVTTPYKGEVVGYQEGDHIIGNPDAPILIVEYSDLECPYCKRFGGVMKEIVASSNGNVAWIYRHLIIHTRPGQNALPKAAAAECIAKLKGNDAFWKYVDLVFDLLKTEESTEGTDNL